MEGLHNLIKRKLPANKNVSMESLIIPLKSAILTKVAKNKSLNPILFYYLPAL